MIVNQKTKASAFYAKAGGVCLAILNSVLEGNQKPLAYMG